MAAKKKILAVLSNRGYWGVELTGPMVNWRPRATSSCSRRPRASGRWRCRRATTRSTTIRPSASAVTTEFDANRSWRSRTPPSWDNPLNLSKWFPERPYFSQENFLRAWEDYYAGSRSAGWTCASTPACSSWAAAAPSWTW